MTTLGNVLSWIISVLVILFLEVPFPVYHIFGILCGIIVYYRTNNVFRKDYNCSGGEYLFVTEKDIRELYKDLDRTEAIKRLDSTVKWSIIIDHALRWPGWGVIEILNVFFPGVFRPKTEGKIPLPDEFDDLKKKF